MKSNHEWIPQKRYRMRVENKEWIYEEAVVKHLIRELNLPEALGIELWKQHKEADPNDFGRLTLPAFCHRANFGFWLGSRRLHEERQLPLTQLLVDFESTYMYRAWHEIAQTMPDGFKYPSLICSVPGRKFMALHTVKSELQSGATRLVIPHREYGTLVLEPLHRLLAPIKRSLALNQ